jgi:putative oxidoreductase
MGLGRLMLRLTLGAIFIEHGTQKLFGWFGGPGLDGTGGMFESIGLRPGRQHAMLAGVTEVSGGSLIAMGLATPAGAAAMAGMMISALKTAVWADGFRAGTGEYEVLLGLVAIALAEEGPGRYSLDAAFGLQRKGPGWAAAALATGAIASALTISYARRQPAPSAQARQTAPEGEPHPTGART